MKFYDGLTEPMIRALERACAGHGLEIMGHVPAALAYEAARIAEVQHFFGVPKPSTLERNALVNRSCDWHAVDEARMDEIVEISLKFGIANTPTIVTNQKMLGYRDYEAARRQPELRHVPPFYLDVIWHPERGRLNNRLPHDYLERQVMPAIAKKQRLTRKAIMVKSQAAAFGNSGIDARRQENSTVIARPVKTPKAIKFQPAPCQMPETRNVMNRLRYVAIMPLRVPPRGM